MKIIDVNNKNVSDLGFFCYMSKKKSEGYARKLNWLAARFAEGLRIKMLQLPERGFIEYIPGEHAWRAVEAEGTMVVHCLWVVGKSKGRGYGGKLLEACVQDARASGLKGVAMVTSEDIWLAGKELLARHGFEQIDSAPPSFSLMVKSFKKGGSRPSFSGDWEKKQRKFGKGLTVVRSGQCPYIVDASAIALAAAKKAGRPARDVVLASSRDIRTASPTAYGVFGLVLDGKLLGTHYLLENELIPLLKP